MVSQVGYLPKQLPPVQSRSSVPDFIGLYGPIVLNTTPIETADPELNKWLGREQTVIMYMGTHFHYTESQVKAVISGFLSAINHDSNTQFLWKLSDRSRFEGLIEGALEDPKDKERFKIVDWLEADPVLSWSTRTLLHISTTVGRIRFMKLPCE